MGILHISRLKTLFQNQIFEFINDEEIKKQKPKINDEELENIKLSQSMLLFALKNITGLDYKDLKNSIVDNFKDNGIDAIFYSQHNNTLYICQSKFSKKGNPNIDKGEILKFLEGINDLLVLNFEKFNEKVKNLKSDIEFAINTPNIRIEIILSHSGNNLSNDIDSLIKEKIEALNDTDEVIFFIEYNLVKAYSDLKEAVNGEPINTDFDISNWGIIDEPYKSYYGIVSCGKIAELAENNSKRLFSKNLRSFIGVNSINLDIVKSLLNKPEDFFYLNNGIVLLCKEIVKSAYNSGKRDIGKFTLKDVSVINGAQTVGAIKFAFNKQPEKVNNSSVFVKVISLENAPEDFDKSITIASNTQNKIEKRDFISLDEEQNRLINEFYLSNLNYHVKRDDLIETKNEKNYYFEEATVSLACFQENIDFSTYAKREIGKLWEDDNYKILFNNKLSVQFLTNIIMVFRATENYIKSLDEQQRHICTHGIYLIVNIIFSNHKTQLLNPNIKIKEFLENDFKNDIYRICHRVVEVYVAKYTQNRIPLSVFKNFALCRDIKNNVLELEGRITSNRQPTLFD
ncbi:AIPR family protein [Riemerella anatipestifer]|uniref:AIPR family protein n=1 Tax=Riemerella anatipestifer TaxID=34085 RepID=UPI00069AAB6C|nr:AIPR family protein [Riemerella anatipestifer]